MFTRLKLKDRVRVHLTNAQTVDGVVSRSDREWVVLVDARLLSEKDPAVLAGETWIPRERVAFAQRGSFD